MASELTPPFTLMLDSKLAALARLKRAFKADGAKSRIWPLREVEKFSCGLLTGSVKTAHYKIWQNKRKHSHWCKKKFSRQEPIKPIKMENYISIFVFFEITGVSQVSAGCFYPVFLNRCDPLKAEISAAKNSSITSDGSSAYTETLITYCICCSSLGVSWLPSFTPEGVCSSDKSEREKSVFHMRKLASLDTFSSQIILLLQCVT